MSPRTCSTGSCTQFGTLFFLINSVTKITANFTRPHLVFAFAADPAVANIAALGDHGSRQGLLCDRVAHEDRLAAMPAYQKIGLVVWTIGAVVMADRPAERARWRTVRVVS